MKKRLVRVIIERNGMIENREEDHGVGRRKMQMPVGQSEKNERYIRYHDEEWGQPLHDDRKLFEMLVMEKFQAGLS